MSGNHYEEQFLFVRKKTSPIMVKKIVKFKLRT
jgi:hypothetical protein